MTWDGKIERRNNPTDHDNLTRLLISVENHVKNFEKHIEEDKISFGSVNEKVDKHAMYIYMGIGALAIIEIALKLK